MNRRWTFACFACAIAAAIGFWAAKQTYGRQEALGGRLSARSEKSATYAMIAVASGAPFWRDIRAAWSTAAATSADVATVFEGPNDTDAQKQIDEVEALIAKGVAGLIIAPADPAALVPTINKAVDRGIPVITYFIDAPTSKRLTYVASELESSSIRMGEFLTSNTDHRGKVIIIYARAGNTEQDARRHGFEELIKRYPGLQLVGVVQDDYDENKGAEQIKPLLIKYPDVKYIFGAHSRAAVGAVSALRELGYKPGQVNVSGSDTDQDVLDLIKEGWVQGSVAQQTTFMTEMMFGILEANRLGYLYPEERSYKQNGIRPLPENIIVPVTLITPKNVLGYFPRKRQ
jgi:ribose transport system substrate-binding protein